MATCVFVKRMEKIRKTQLSVQGILCNFLKNFSCNFAEATFHDCHYY